MCAAVSRSSCTIFSCRFPRRYFSSFLEPLVVDLTVLILAGTNIYRKLISQ